MEAHVPTQRTGPRNLARHVAQLLRELGFTVLETTHPSVTTVAGHWLAPNGCLFDATYDWWLGRKAVFQLRLTSPGDRFSTPLVQGQHVGRVQEARRLLLNDERLRAARAAGQVPVALPT